MGFKTRVEYEVTIHTEDDASMWAEVTDLPGCFATGDSMDELRANLAEAIGLYLSTERSPLKMEIEGFAPKTETAKLVLCSSAG